eukprot:SAG11_NODE_33206_length_278_cov_1.435754_1_plen_21_part_01
MVGARLILSVLLLLHAMAVCA